MTDIALREDVEIVIDLRDERPRRGMSLSSIGNRLVGLSWLRAEAERVLVTGEFVRQR